MSLNDWLLSKGFNISVVLDGKVHRFQIDKGDKDGWYIGSDSSVNSKRIETLTIGNWKTGEKYSYPENGMWSGLSDAERAELGRKREEGRALYEKEREELALAASIRAKEIWNLATNVSLENAYIQKKGISPIGVRQSDQDIVVPMFIDDKLIGLQRILPNGEKRFLPGQNNKGACFLMLAGGVVVPELVLVCEGYATGATLIALTKKAVCVAFNAGNLGPACESIKRQFPDTKIIICADDDRWGDLSKGNPGLDKARECGYPVVSPRFLDESLVKKPTDYNDLYVLEGKKRCGELLAAQINEALENMEKNESSLKEGTNPVDSNPDEVGPRSEAKGDDMEGAGTESEGDEEGDGEVEKKKDLNKKRQALAKRILDARYKLQVESGQSILYKITNIKKKELKVCYNPEEVLRRLSTNLFEVTKKVYSPKQVKEFYDLWRLSTDALKEKPGSFAWSDQDEWCFKKLEFKPTKGVYPEWEQFLSRLSSKDDFMAFVWSIFEMKNKSRQFLYLSDPAGETGKSSVIKVLGWVFGDSFTAISNSTVSGANYRWLMGQLYGKRLVAWPDCKNPKFCMSETVRNFTSGDSVVVEFKGESPFAVEMYLKFIIGSNHEPQITSGGADVSRLIHIRVSENKDKKDDPTWIDKLKKELEYFLYDCREVYKRKCPNHGKIVLDSQTIDSVMDADEEIESPFEALCESRFVFKEGNETSVSEWVDFCKKEKLTDFSVGNLKEYLKRHHGVIIKRSLMPSGKKITRYIGFKIVDKAQGSIIEDMASFL